MSTPPTNPDDGPFNIRNGIIPADSALRGAAASRMPVTEEDLPELQRLVDGVNRYNLVYPPNGVPNLGSIIYRPPGYNVTNPVYRFVREKPGIVFLEGFRPWGPQEGPEHLWAGNSTYFNLYRHVNERGPPATPPNFMCVFASTTLSRQWCPPPPTDGGTVFRYEIYAPGGIHVHETLRSHYYFPAQDEVSFLGGIASVFIRSAQEFRITYRNGRYDDLMHYYATGVANTKNYLDAAFRSSRTDEAYLFVEKEYVLLNYAPDSTNDRVVNGPLFIFDGFVSLGETAFAEVRVDCAFGVEGKDEVFIFSGAKINYAPGTTKDWIIEGPMSIADMFPFFENSGYARGLDAAFELSSTEACIFRGKYCAQTNHVEKRLIQICLITDAFPCLKDTVLASDIGAAFRSHRDSEAYLFKGPQYALLKYSSATSLAGGVKEIAPNWPSLKGFVPRENFGLDYYPHPHPPPYRPDPYDEL
ncbi:hypothetical protein Cgig2_005344 [Carnegiea gigantea]|uniref:Pierisin-like domain-containing protein n=1 Tax=Carnegiea gigantea TaxID=171969 RepID=A0A9Q1QCW4_9CARY|nr:hypothetical protein Cgig2_005344 [Carnegiea gigantea]